MPGDLQKARVLHRRACQARDALARGDLADLLANCAGGTPEPNRVVALYRRGGVLGSAQGCNNLADLYHEGVGVPGDPARAAALFRRAYRRVFKPACSSQ